MTSATQRPVVDVGNATDLRIERRGALVEITFDRPEKLNAITGAMRARLAEALPGISRDPEIYVVILRAAPCKVFSAGGDVRELYGQVLADPADAVAALAHEYALIWQIDCCFKPTVALIDGAAMGSGVGITLYSTHRVATPDYRFQMPETAIGFFPDDGVSHVLARLPGQVGIYLGLTGASIGPADAYRLGLVTHCMPAQQFATVESALANADPVDPVLDQLHTEPGPAPLDQVADAIARCFCAPTVRAIVERLEAEPNAQAWCTDVARTLRARSPLALEVTLRHIRQAAQLDLRQTLMLDHRVGSRLAVGHDFKEGIRALLIDKDGDPDWQPRSLEEVTPAMLNRVFAPMTGGSALVLPTRQEMHPWRDV